VNRRAHRTETADATRLRHAARTLGLRIGLFAAVIVLVLSGLAVAIVVQSQHRAADTLLEQTATRADDVTDPPAGVWLAVRGPHGTTTTPGAPDGLPLEPALASVAATGATTFEDYHHGDVEYRVLTVRRGDRAVQAALDLTANHAERTRLAVALLLTGGLGLVLAAIAGMALARNAVRPMATALTLQRQFVSDASHELRTPLTLLSTRVQMLHRHLAGSGARKDLLDESDGVVADTRHLTAVLDDLLLAADPSSTPDEPFDLTVLVGEVVTAHQAAAQDEHIALTVRRPGSPVPVRGARTAVGRAVTALVDNAVRHATTAVTVTVATEGRMAVVDVADDGPGIAPDVLPRLFDRFATTRGPDQLGAARRRYGLGLALVSDIAARHNGAVDAAEAPDGGALLRLTLPLDPTT
jgi:two-component system, OmpR family, sensor kinase